jgi:phage gp16-like protein
MKLRCPSCHASNSLEAFTADDAGRELLRLLANSGPLFPAGRSYNSRAAQLAKIEALLTIGGKPWAYGDALAKRICKVERIAWVPDRDLYKIITALRMQAKREGWDLSGEGK